MKQIKNTKTTLLLLSAGFLASWTAVAQDEKPAVKFNALLQSWFVYDGSDTTSLANFRVRRAELKASGNAGDEVQWFVMVDPAKSPVVGTPKTDDNKILQDLGVVWTPVSGLEFSMGQQKTRTKAEGLASASELPLPERSLVGRNFGDSRQPGAMVAYKGEGYKTALMVSNGQKTNVDDINSKKDLSFRVDVDVAEGLSLGAFTLMQDFSYKDLGRFGANLEYKTDSFLLRTEGVYQKGCDKNAMGIMADLSYLTETFSPVVRYEYYQADTDSDLSAKVTTAGVNYFLSGKKNKIQAAVSYLQGVTSTLGTPKTLTANADGPVFYLTFQAAL